MGSGKIPLANTILRGVVGSTAHGTGREGQEDRDEMGVFVEPPEAVCGLAPLDHWIYRDAAEGERSKPGDLDLVLYSLRKFCRLAVNGNPSVLLLLWLPSFEISTDLGARLIGLRDAFVSRKAGSHYLGYLRSQKAALLGERSPRVSRPDLVGAFGYDTKYAMHALRLGLQGIEFLKTRHIDVPVAEPQRTLLLSIRKGELPFDEVLARIGEAEGELEALTEANTATVDVERVDRFLVEAHFSHWGR